MHEGCARICHESIGSRANVIVRDATAYIRKPSALTGREEQTKPILFAQHKTCAYFLLS